MSNSSEPGRLATLLKLLERDPANLSLLSDAADAAIKQHEPEAAQRLLDRYASYAVLGDRQRNLAGLAFMQLDRFEEASVIFTALLASATGDANLRFNQAWCLAKLGQSEAGLALLNDKDVETLGHAAQLRVHLLHDLGRLDEALAEAKRLVVLHPEHRGLSAAASIVGIDAEDLSFAAECAKAAPGQVDALTTLGTIALSEDRNADAEAFFSQALEKDPNSPRALIGVGLGGMLKGNYPKAAQAIELGATLFVDHIGSWVAAGWAHLFANDLAAARRCFDTALAVDRTFGETHGSLAVLELIEGHAADAQREAETARRLDPQSFSAALARAMLASSSGEPDRARAILDRALNVPIDRNGRTIAHALARHGLSL
jgi:tetratricopeptide (TPR) repeat protein